MSKLKRLLTPGVTAALFVAAAVLLLTSGIGGARAVLTYFTEEYMAQVDMYDIGVTLVENGAAVAWRNYVPNSNDKWSEAEGVLLSGGENSWQSDQLSRTDGKLRLGFRYREELSVRNSGTIPQYVRVTVYKYWLGEDGEKRTDMEPDWIDLHFPEGSGWHISEEPGDNTEERTVLYYDAELEPGAATAPFTDTLAIKPEVGIKVHEERDGSAIKTVYDYDGTRFEIKAVVNAVQNHNADAAKWSSWGTAG